jgi:YHS domain-containing protein
MTDRRNVLSLATAALLLTATIPGTRAWADTSRLALKGYDPVAYFTEGRPVPGKAEYEYAWDEARYRFASAENMTLFTDEPDRYAPQFGASCAGGVSMGVKVEADPEAWLIHDGRLFVFSKAAARKKFQADPEAMAAAAHAKWQQLKDAPMGTKLSQ